MWKEQDPEQRDLVTVMDEELSGNFKDGILMLVKGQARLDAEVLYDALKGVGTDEERMNEILTGRHPGQVEDIKAEYLKLGDNVTDQESLWDAVMGDTTFKYERFLKSMLDRGGFLAFLCYEAMHGNKYDFTGVTGVGTNEDMLIRVLLSVNRDNDGVKTVLKEYDDSFDVGWKEDLERLAHLPDVEDIKSAFPRLSALGFGCNGGDGDSKEQAAELWNEVNNGPFGSNPYNSDGTFYYCCQDAVKDSWEEIGNSPSVWKAGNFFHVGPKCPNPHFSAYAMPSTHKAFKVPMGKTLAHSLEHDTMFDFKDMLLWLVKDKDIGAAEAIHDTFEDASISQDTVMAIMASRSNSMRTEIAVKYEKMYGNPDYKQGMKLSKLKEDITEKLEGDFAEVARDMFQDGDQRCADYCFLAMHGHNKDDELEEKGIVIDESKQDGAGGQVENLFRTGMIGSMGTDEQRLNRTILFSSKSELKGLIEAYRSKYGGWDGTAYDAQAQVEGVGPTLYEDVFSEIGGDHRRLLMYRFRQATTGMMWIPRQKLMRLDDMPSNFPIDVIAQHDII